MAESKSEQFSFLINRLSEKTAKFSPNSINRLGRVSECRPGNTRSRHRPITTRGCFLGTLTAQSPIVQPRRLSLAGDSNLITALL